MCPCTEAGWMGESGPGLLVAMCLRDLGRGVLSGARILGRGGGCTFHRRVPDAL